MGVHRFALCNLALQLCLLLLEAGKFGVPTLHKGQRRCLSRSSDSSFSCAVVSAFRASCSWLHLPCSCLHGGHWDLLQLCLSKLQLLNELFAGVLVCGDAGILLFNGAQQCLALLQQVALGLVSL